MKNLRFRLALAGVATIVALGLAACSADSPTAPRQPAGRALPVQTDSGGAATQNSGGTGLPDSDSSTTCRGGGMVGSGGRC